MKQCEEFEVAIEMRRHGALGPEATVELQEHLLGCSSCRAFESMSQATEETLKESSMTDVAAIDWDGVKHNLRAKISRENWQNWKIGGVLLVGQAIASFTFNVGHRTQALRGQAVLAAIIVGIVALAGFLRTWRLRAYEKTKEDLLFFHRRYLESRLTKTSVATVVTGVLAPAYLLVRVMGPMSERPIGIEEWLGALLMTVLLLGVAAFLLFVRRPQLKRELDALLRR